MTDRLRAAAQAALEALENDCDWRVRSDASRGLRAALTESDSDWSLLAETQESLFEHMAEIHLLRAALAEQEVDSEPVAWMDDDGNLEWNRKSWMDDRYFLVYRRPPRSEWKGLTDEEVNGLWVSQPTISKFARAIEAKLKEKNRG